MTELIAKTLDLTTLNQQQIDAVLLNEGPFLVLAGAGSGKTRVLTHRVRHLLESRETNPHEIMAVTFTNKAAREMKSRLLKSSQSTKAIEQVWIGTFHGLCNRLLRQEIDNFELFNAQEKALKWSKNFVISDSAETLTSIKSTLSSLNLDEKIYPPKQIQSLISNLKNQSLTAYDFARKASNPQEKKLAEIYFKYQDKLQQSNALDFDDLLLFTLQLFQKNPERRLHYHKRFSHILVDEFQDTNQTQYDLLKSLLVSPEGRNATNWNNRSFCAVGDIDQSIYSWRGANYKLALNFQKDFPEAQLIKLEFNYRSTEPILVAANAVIQNNSQRIDKSLIGTRGKGEKIICFEASDEMEEANYIASEIKRLKDKGLKQKEIAVLYRTNAQSRAIEEGLIKNRIAYHIIGGMRFYDRLEIKDLLAYLRLMFNPKDTNALKRIINTPKRGIGASTIAQIEEKADSMGLSLYEALADLVDSKVLGPKIVQSAHDFINLINSLIDRVDKLAIPDLIRAVMEESGYLFALEATENEDTESRIENIHELVNVAQQFHEESEDKTLGAFLAQVSLVGDVEKDTDADDAITLLTVHSAKGLEYKSVFLTGLEEGIFPHSRALGSSPTAHEELEEERRLMYVAITRAEDKLYITYARRRRLWGQREYSEPSRFLEEIPKDHLTGYWGSSATKNESKNLGNNSGYGLKELKVNGASSSNNLKTQISEPKSVINKVAKPEIKFQTGDKVTHKTFGVGTILSLFGNKSQPFYSVQFESDSGKKLLSGDSLNSHFHSS